MAWRELALLGSGLLLTVLTSGCAAPAEPRPPGLETTTRLEATGLETTGLATSVPEVPAPDIEHQRDARGADPCRLLTNTQLDGLRLAGPGAAAAAPEGPHCEWRGPGATVLGVTLYTDGGGITTLARNSESTTRRVRVSGYPALETFTGRGEFCQYDIGIDDAQVVMLAMDGPTPDSCSTLQTVVAMIVGNLPAAGS
jgi:Protein of unknown function (DUF3558)